MGSRRDTDASVGAVFPSGAATAEDYTVFAQYLATLPKEAASWWANTLYMPSPLVRFKINLNRLSDCLLQGTITTVIPDGVTEHELKMLKAISHLPKNCVAVGHELLNLHERQQFIETFRATLNALRSRGGRHG